MERMLAAILAADVEFNSLVDAVDCAGGPRRHRVGDVR